MGKKHYLIQAFASVGLTMSLLLIYPAQAMAPVHKVAPKKSVTLNTFSPKLYALTLLRSRGIDQFGCLDRLWTFESHWNPKARNSTPVLQGGKWLHAFGIAQKLTEKSKVASRQIENGLDYITRRYSTPCKALSWHYRHGWY